MAHIRLLMEDTTSSSSRLLHNQTPNQLDADETLCNIYEHFHGGGFYCILTKELCKVCTLLFTLAVTFLLLIAPWRQIFECNASTCSSVEEYALIAIHSNMYTAKALVFMAVAYVASSMRAYSSFNKIRQAWRMNLFFKSSLRLHIVDYDELTWRQVLTAIQDAQLSSNVLGLPHFQITEREIVSRIMRSTNYT